MYRNSAQKRACGCMNNMNEQKECNDKMCNVIEDVCSNVENYNKYDMCDCGFDEDNTFPSNYMYAQSYVPMQKLGKTFVPPVGLKMGTIFPELVSPYKPGQSMEEIDFIRRKNMIGEGCNK